MTRNEKVNPSTLTALRNEMAALSVTNREAKTIGEIREVNSRILKCMMDERWSLVALHGRMLDLEVAIEQLEKEVKGA